MTVVETACPNDTDIDIREGRKEGKYMNPLTSGYLYEAAIDDSHHKTDKQPIKSSTPSDNNDNKTKGEATWKEPNMYELFRRSNKSIGNALSFLEHPPCPAVALVTTKTTCAVGGARDLAASISSLLEIEVGVEPLGWMCESE
eukprot:gnl/Chilomastix_caulleri/3980.p1 GENE.gnl/Chilomastix_caulleri/3980~~gnl/Chilomastix_caulleri/3980.p1  ORF type:complete len:156 (-),score=60.90 gnl/Chilomastix_caulleri/3980:97-525(-)